METQRDADILQDQTEHIRDIQDSALRSRIMRGQGAWDEASVQEKALLSLWHELVAAAEQAGAGGWVTGTALRSRNLRLIGAQEDESDYFSQNVASAILPIASEVCDSCGIVLKGLEADIALYLAMVDRAGGSSLSPAPTLSRPEISDTDLNSFRLASDALSPAPAFYSPVSPSPVLPITSIDNGTANNNNDTTAAAAAVVLPDAPVSSGSSGMGQTEDPWIGVAEGRKGWRTYGHSAPDTDDPHSPDTPDTEPASDGAADKIVTVCHSLPHPSHT